MDLIYSKKEPNRLLHIIHRNMNLHKMIDIPIFKIGDKK